MRLPASAGHRLLQRSSGQAQVVWKDGSGLVKAGLLFDRRIGLLGGTVRVTLLAANARLRLAYLAREQSAPMELVGVERIWNHGAVSGAGGLLTLSTCRCAGVESPQRRPPPMCMTRVEEELVEDSAWAEVTPVSSTLLIIGSFDVPTAGVRVYYDSPQVESLPGGFRDRWSPIWSRLTKVSDESPSRYTTAMGIVAKIDRVFMSLPPWAVCGVIVGAFILEDPAVPFRSGFSGLSAVQVQMPLRCRVPASERPSARRFTKDKLYPEILCRTLELWHDPEVSVQDQMALCGLAARSSTRVVRDSRKGAAGGEHCSRDRCCESGLDAAHQRCPGAYRASPRAQSGSESRGTEWS